MAATPSGDEYHDVVSLLTTVIWEAKDGLEQALPVSGVGPRIIIIGVLAMPNPALVPLITTLQIWADTLVGISCFIILRFNGKSG
jgi:hypothetical protein